MMRLTVTITDATAETLASHLGRPLAGARTLGPLVDRIVSEWEGAQKPDLDDALALVHALGGEVASLRARVEALEGDVRAYRIALCLPSP